MVEVSADDYFGPLVRSNRRKPVLSTLRSRKTNYMTDRVFIGNLAFTVTTEELRQALSAYGEVRDVKIATDRETGQPRGFAFATMDTSANAANVIASFNGTMIGGRAVRVDEATARKPAGGR